MKVAFHIIIGSMLLMSIDIKANTEQDISLRAIPLRVQYGSESFFIIVVSYDETVETAKAHIEKKTGIPADNQLLHYLSQELMDNKQSLSHYGVGSYNQNPVIAVVQDQENGPIAKEVSPRAILIRVFHGVKGFYVIVPSPSETIATVKSLINKKTGIPEDQQVLHYAVVELQDHVTVQDAGLINEDNSVITLAVEKSKNDEPSQKATAIRIFYGSDAFQVQINDYYQTVLKTKEDINKVITGLEPVDQMLSFFSHEMSNSYTLENYGVDDYSLPVLVVSKDLGL